MKIRAKMTGILLCCGLIPLASAVAVGYLSVNSVLKSVRDNADQALTQAVESSFQGQRDLKRAQIEDYFKTINDQVLTFADNRMVVESMRHFRAAFRTYRAEAGIDVTKLADMRRELEDFYVNKFGAEFASQNSGREIEAKRLLGQLQDDTVALQHAYIAANPNPLGSKHLLDSAETSTRYGELHEVSHPVVRNYLDKFGYYDIFLIDSETGEIVYSVFKEIDYGTSLMDGPYAQTNFGKAFRKAKQLGKDGGAVLVDFAQ